MLVVARTGTDERTGRGLLSLFVVPTEAPGLERQPIDVAMVTPEKQFTLFFDDVAVPAENLIGEEDNGLPQLFFGLNPERITGAAFAVGAGLLALGEGLPLRERAEGLGRADRRPPRARARWRSARSSSELAKLMTYKAAWATTRATTRARQRTWRTTPPPRRRWPASTRRSRCTGRACRRRGRPDEHVGRAPAARRRQSRDDPQLHRPGRTPGCRGRTDGRADAERQPDPPRQPRRHAHPHRLAGARRRLSSPATGASPTPSSTPR